MEEHNRRVPPTEQGTPQAVDAVEQGIRYAEDGAYDRAIECFTMAIRLSPECADAYFARACTHDIKGEFDLAIDDCTNVIRLDPQRATAYHLRGQVYGKTGQWAKAERDVAKARRFEARQK